MTYRELCVRAEKLRREARQLLEDLGKKRTSHPADAAYDCVMIASNQLDRARHLLNSLAGD